MKTTNTIPQRVLAYCRVSGRLQATAGNSLQDQQKQIRDFCKAKGYPEPEFFIEQESAARAKEEARIQQKALLSRLQPNDLVVVCKLDRWSRSTQHQLDSVNDVILTRNANWYSISEGFDPRTPNGQFTMTVMAAVATQEHARIKERTVGMRKVLRAEGAHVEGKPPFGYKRADKVGSRRPDRLLHIVPDEAALVKEIFERAANGASCATLAKWAKQHHPQRKWSDSYLSQMLNCRLYLGEVLTDNLESGGKWIASHEAIIDPALWARVQSGLHHRKTHSYNARENSKTANWLLRSMGSCASCGGRMTPAYGMKTHYYVCLNHKLHKCTAEKRVNQGWADSEVEKQALAHLDQIASALSTWQPSAIATPDFEARRNKIQEKRSRFQEAFADGNMTGKELAEWIRKLEVEAGAVEQEEKSFLEANASNDPAKLAIAIVLVEGLSKLSGNEMTFGRDEYARQILRWMSSRITLEGDKTPVVSWRPVAELVATVGSLVKESAPVRTSPGWCTLRTVNDRM